MASSEDGNDSVENCAPIDRRAFLRTAGAGAAGLLGGAALAGSKRDNRGDHDRPPNFVVIFVDDMGYGDIEPFGSTVNDTPHLNRMASEGMKLTSFYVADSVCTPSRAALLTGCYPKRVGLARGPNHAVLFPGDPEGLNQSEENLANILSQEGYATGCFGKWHLGDQPAFLPTSQGFDYYYGIPYSNDMWPGHPRAGRGGIWNFPPLPVVRNGEVVDTVDDMQQQGLLCKKFTDEAVSFIRRHRDEPFFVYVPHAFVHHPRGARREFLERAGAEEELDWDAVAENPWSQRLRVRTKAQIAEVDWSVGQILQTLRDLGLSSNTFVLFTSDNGGSRGCSNAPLRGGKGNPWEGGQREPTIAWWPGTVSAGVACDELATTMDLFPTFAKLSGAAPGDLVIDGNDISNLLLKGSEAKTPTERFFYYQRDNLRAVRSGPWKLFANGRLYNLDEDIGEKHNVAKQHPEVVEQLRGYLEEARKDLGDGKDGPGCRPPGRVKNPEPLLTPADYSKNT